jgi:hypothetical protein
MYQGVIRNNRQRDEMIEVIKQMRLPFKFAFQDIYPTKSPDQLAYLFGVVYKEIAEYTGHDIIEIHAAFKSLFNMEYAEENGIWDFRVKGISRQNTNQLSEFTEKVVAYATVDFRLNIPQPSEVIVNNVHETFNNISNGKEKCTEGQRS